MSSEDRRHHVLCRFEDSDAESFDFDVFCDAADWEQAMADTIEKCDTAEHFDVIAIGVYDPSTGNWADSDYPAGNYVEAMYQAGLVPGTNKPLPKSMRP